MFKVIYVGLDYDLLSCLKPSLSCLKPSSFSTFIFDVSKSDTTPYTSTRRETRFAYAKRRQVVPWCWGNGVPSSRRASGLALVSSTTCRRVEEIGE